MSGLTWIHLSDWHQQGKDFDREVVRDKLMEDIRGRAAIAAELERVDFIIFSGDVAYHGRTEEYGSAIEHFFDPLLDATGLGEAGRERLFIVPGNHDLDRDFLDVLPGDLLKRLNNPRALSDWLSDERKRRALMGPMDGYRRFVSDYLGGYRNFGAYEPDYWYTGHLEIRGRQITVFCFNSAWLAARNKDDRGEVYDYGYLILGEPQIHAALARSTETDVRIALIHHPFSWLTEFDRNRVEERLGRECHFILCGHQHVPQIKVEHGTGGDFVNIPAGACYDRRVPLEPRYANSYNFVHLDFDTRTGTVYLRRLSDRKTEWITDIDVAEEGKYSFRLPKELGAPEKATEPEPRVVPFVQAPGIPQSTPFEQFESDLRTWLKVCSHQLESHYARSERHFTFVTNEPITGGYDRIVVYGVEGEATANAVKGLAEAVDRFQTHRGWLIAMRRIASSARELTKKDERLRSYTFDELVDQKANFDKYFNWLEDEVKRREIDRYYIDLGCTKDDLDPETGDKLGTSHYERIDDYIGQWLDDPVAEHISILGEFGTGKTWFSLHYAYRAMQAHKAAKEAGRRRPRLPLVIQLRDFIKAMDIETLLSDFFFRRFEIGLPGYTAYEQLNRMGKLLLIFDGFDEMADRTNRQKQIDNFWQLARAVGPGSKAILTCRTEHFEFAKAAIKTFHGEETPTISPEAKVPLEPPRFEIISVEKLSPQKITQILLKREGEERGPLLSSRIHAHPALADLAQRAGSIELIIAALPSLDERRKIDLARVLLHATRELLLKNIRERRSFTSMADKVHFLCELAWQMLSTGEMRINFAQFPDRLRQYQPELKERDIDHWRFDLGGQTLLIPDDEGNYSFSHKSLTEFFVAYKFAAELGLFSTSSEWITGYFAGKEKLGKITTRQWHDFFICPDKEGTCGERVVEKDGSVRCKREAGTCIGFFGQEPFESLATTFGLRVLTPEVVDFLTAMTEETRPLWNLVEATAGKTLSQAAYLGGNAVTLLNRLHEPLTKRTLKNVFIAGADLTGGDLTETDLGGAILCGARLTGATLVRADFRKADLSDISVEELTAVVSMAWSPDGQTLATATSDNKLFLWHALGGGASAIVIPSPEKIRQLRWDPSGRKLYAACGGRILTFVPDSKGAIASSDIGGWVSNITVDGQGHFLAVRRSIIERMAHRGPPYSRTLREVLLLDMNTGKVVTLLSVSGDFNYPTLLRFSQDGTLLYVGRYNGNVQVFDATGKKKRGRNLFDKTSVTALAVAAGANIICGSSNGSVVFCNPQLIPSNLSLPVEYESKILQIEVNSKSGEVAILDQVGELHVWTREGLQRLNLTSETEIWTSVEFEPEGRFLAAAAGPSVHIFDLRRSSSSFGRTVHEFGQTLRCTGMRIGGASGLEGPAPSGKGTLGEWLRNRGALLNSPKERTSSPKKHRSRR